MAKINLYKQDGRVNGSVELSDALFAVKVKPDVIHEALVAQLANGRTRYAQTKDRSEVRGGGKKPWKQKGTGRARHGSSRSPIWTGGGVTFGPLAVRTFLKKINKKTRRAALAMVLTDKLAAEQFIVLDSLAIEEAKTRTLGIIREALPGSGHSTLIITSSDEKNAIQAAKNLAKVSTISAKSLNVRDLLKSKYILASQAALEEMKATYLA